MDNDVTVQVRQVSATASEAAIRQHRLTIDRPAAKGGSDFGPMGGELFLASVGGCFMSNLLAAITARGSDVSGVRTEVTGTLDGVPSHFVGIQLQVSADRAGREEFTKLVEIADRACIMTNTLREALDLTVRIAAASDTGL